MCNFKLNSAILFWTILLNILWSQIATAEQKLCKARLVDGKRQVECISVCPNNCRPYGICNKSRQRCDCFPGYHLENKRCVETNCLAGYKAVTLDDAPHYKCEPICTNECLGNSYCAAPDKCECKMGYRTRNKYDADVGDAAGNDACVPDCQDKPCGLHETCTAPEQCSCYTNYTRSPDDGRCKPICVDGCKTNAFCTKPNVCECNEGYRNVDGESDGNNCEPICKPACNENAICLRPDECACKTGFKQISTNVNRCEPICDEVKCVENSICSDVNQCKCKEGYLPEYNANQNDTAAAAKIIIACLPDCEANKCGPNAECVAPNICRCREHYTNATGVCQHTCIKGCPEHATCIGPNQCQCAAGYSNSADQSKCLAECKNIKCGDADDENAYCHAPDVCRCKDGYQMDTQLNGKCRPICLNGCPKHAACIAPPNECRCNEGYQMKNESCLPKCTPADCPATLAACIEPDICQCYANEKRFDSSQLIIGMHICNLTQQQQPVTTTTDMKELCLKDLYLLIATTKVSCNLNGFFIFSIYAAMFGFLLICIFITVKGYQRFQRSCYRKAPNDNHYVRPLDFVITYRPDNQTDEQTTATRAEFSNYAMTDTIRSKRSTDVYAPCEEADNLLIGRATHASGGSRVATPPPSYEKCAF